MSKVGEWLQIAGLLAAAALLFFGDHIANLIRFDQDQVVGMIAAILAADFSARLYASYVERRQNGSFATFRSLPLDRAMQEARDLSGHVKSLRIFAISSGKIQPLVETMQIKAEVVQILLWRPWTGGAFQAQLAGFEAHISALEADWNELQRRGQFGSLSVKRYSELPGDYYILFDDKAVIIGTYRTNDVVYSLVDVNDTILIRADSEAGRRVIRNYSERFDSMAKIDWANVP